MSDDFLSRWSRRKIAVRKGESLDEPAKARAAAAPAAGREAPAAGVVPEPSQALPPVESLTTESDFSPFMKADVDPGLRRQALQVLLRDPRFNVMDGLDVYIDDFSKPDPLPPEWLDQLKQLKHMGHYVEDSIEAAGKEAPEAPAEPSPRLQKAIPEQPVEPLPPDTAQGRDPDAPVAESGTPGK